MLVFLGKAIIFADRNICDALRDKRLIFGIRTIYRVFVSSETILCIFYTDALVPSNPPSGPNLIELCYANISKN